MVHKIRIIFLYLIFFILCFIGVTHKGKVETNLLKTLLPKQVINSTDIVPIADKSSSLIKVVFEAEDENSLDKLSSDFINQIDKNYFEFNKPDISNLLEKYLSQPTNFLSADARKLLNEKMYDTVYSKSIETLYNPTGIQLTPLDKDPYLLLDDFILSNRKTSNIIDYKDGKFYDFLSLRIKGLDGLSPDLCNKQISKIVKLQHKLSNKNAKIYLGGTPVHSYYTSKRSVTDINIICILSTLMIVLLIYSYFRNLKLLLPIILSISFGMLSGYVGTKLWFDSFQIITMVFSTTLIGIGIDYSFHYFFAIKKDNVFVKNLSFSFLTTIVPFILLYFTGIELLKQVAIFTIFGLLGIYLIVLFIYPCFTLPKASKTIDPNYSLYKLCLITLCILGVIGLFRIHFNDNLSALYSPAKALKKAEALYGKISGDISDNTQFITVKGNSLNDIIQTEESVTKNLDENNIEYVALSKFVPSKNRQEENFRLVKNLYENNLDKYSDILSSNQIQTLKNSSFSPVIFDVENYPYLQDLMLNSNTSMIAVFSDKNLDYENENVKVINFQSDIKNYMKHYRHLLLMLFPLVILVLGILLCFLYDFKKSVKILIPSLVGIGLSVLLTSLIYGEINLFSVITIFLVLGFTMDYSIFRTSQEEQTESAIFVSCLTTSFSFLLLALCGFKLLSSMALILFFGIVISYITGFLLFTKHGKIQS